MREVGLRGSMLAAQRGFRSDVLRVAMPIAETALERP